MHQANQEKQGGDDDSLSKNADQNQTVTLHPSEQYTMIRRHKLKAWGTKNRKEIMEGLALGFALGQSSSDLKKSISWGSVLGISVGSYIDFWNRNIELIGHFTNPSGCAGCCLIYLSNIKVPILKFLGPRARLGLLEYTAIEQLHELGAAN
jgi:hypothetical protein